MTPPGTLHSTSAAAHRVTAEAYEAAAKVLQQRDPLAALRHQLRAASQRSLLEPATA